MPVAFLQQSGPGCSTPPVPTLPKNYARSERFSGCRYPSLTHYGHEVRPTQPMISEPRNRDPLQERQIGARRERRLQLWVLDPGELGPILNGYRQRSHGHQSARQGRKQGNKLIHLDSTRVGTPHSSQTCPVQISWYLTSCQRCTARARDPIPYSIFRSFVHDRSIVRNQSS